MGSTITLEMSPTTFSDIIWYIELAIKSQNDTNDIIDMVHTIDFLEEERMRSSSKDNEYFRRSMEMDKLFSGEKQMDIDKMELFLKISFVLHDYYDNEIINKMSPQDEFYFIYEIIEKIQEVIK